MVITKYVRAHGSSISCPEFLDQQINSRKMEHARQNHQGMKYFVVSKNLHIKTQTSGKCLLCSHLERTLLETRWDTATPSVADEIAICAPLERGQANVRHTRCPQCCKPLPQVLATVNCMTPVLLPPTTIDAPSDAFTAAHANSHMSSICMCSRGNTALLPG